MPVRLMHDDNLSLEPLASLFAPQLLRHSQIRSLWTKGIQSLATFFLSTCVYRPTYSCIMAFRVMGEKTHLSILSSTLKLIIYPTFEIRKNNSVLAKKKAAFSKSIVLIHPASIFPKNLRVLHGGD